MRDFSEKHSLDTDSTNLIDKIKEDQYSVLLITRILNSDWIQNRETLYLDYISETNTWYVYMERRTGDPVKPLPEEKLGEFLDDCETIETTNRKFDDDSGDTIPDELNRIMKQKRGQTDGQSGLNDFS